MRRSLVAAGVLLVAAVGVVLCCSNGQRPAEKPAPDEVVIQVGPFDITQGELDRWVPWVRSIDPALAPAYIRRTLLGDLLLPERVVGQAVGPERIAEVQRRADQLAGLIAQGGGTVKVFLRLGKQYGIREHPDYYPPLNKLEVPVANAVFTTPVGRCTGAIRGSTGCVVAGIVDERIESRTPKRRISSVFMEYSGGKLTTPELRRRVKALTDGRAWVHPYHRDDFETFFGSLADEPMRE